VGTGGERGERVGLEPVGLWPAGPDGVWTLGDKAIRWGERLP
jgi:hypothetical protein